MPIFVCFSLKTNPCTSTSASFRFKTKQVPLYSVCQVKLNRSSSTCPFLHQKKPVCVLFHFKIQPILVYISLSTFQIEICVHICSQKKPISVPISPFPFQTPSTLDQSKCAFQAEIKNILFLSSRLPSRRLRPDGSGTSYRRVQVLNWPVCSLDL